MRIRECRAFVLRRIAGIGRCLFVIIFYDSCLIVAITAPTIARVPFSSSVCSLFGYVMIIGTHARRNERTVEQGNSNFDFLQNRASAAGRH